jgi:hypothetical protein
LHFGGFPKVSDFAAQTDYAARRSPSSMSKVQHENCRYQQQKELRAKRLVEELVGMLGESEEFVKGFIELLSLFIFFFVLVLAMSTQRTRRFQIDHEFIGSWNWRASAKGSSCWLPGFRRLCEDVLLQRCLWHTDSNENRALDYG